MRLSHARTEIELHRLSSEAGPTLLLLHQLFGSSAEWSGVAEAWPGTVYALDFSGHGRSQWFEGGAYSAEHFAANADIALQEIGPAVVAGAGLGAYVALLIAGGRPSLVPGALLLPGCGLAGAGAEPDNTRALPDFNASLRADRNGGDPMTVCVEMFLRPTEYARRFADAARCLLLAEDCSARPPWWHEIRNSHAARPVRGSVAELLPALARVLAAQVE